MATTFDLFDTLVTVSRPADPAAAVADQLRARDVPVPDDWGDAYREVHVDAPDGAEVPLPAHVAAALRSRGVDPLGRGEGNVVRRAVVAAFDPEVRTRDGAVEAVLAAGEAGPVGLLSNCSVPELAARSLVRSALDRDAFDAAVTSAGCGWRKPHPDAFASVARRLGVDPADLRHVGDDPAADGGVTRVGGRFVDVGETPLPELARRFEARATGDPAPDDDAGAADENAPDDDAGAAGENAPGDPADDSEVA